MSVAAQGATRGRDRKPKGTLMSTLPGASVDKIAECRHAVLITRDGVLRRSRPISSKRPGYASDGEVGLSRISFASA